MNMRLFIWLIASVLLCFACNSEREHERIDTGRACFIQEGGNTLGALEGQEISADVPLEVHIFLDDPAINACDDLVAQECTAMLQGNMINIKSRVSWIPRDKHCDEYLSVEMVCYLGPLANGSYTVVYGSRSMTLNVPSTGACLPRGDEDL